jgi:hypothetical protein
MLHTGATSTIVQVRGREGFFLEGPQEIITLDHTRKDHGEDVLHDAAAREPATTFR